jgi:hypothetical protein
MPINGNTDPDSTTCDGAEAGFDATKLAITPPISTTDNMGFLRDSANLFIINVTDDDDVSSGDTSEYIDLFHNLKGPGNQQLVSFNAIAGPPPDGCGMGDADPSPRFQQVAQACNGQIFDICNPSWAGILSSIATAVTTLRASWTLSRAADPNTISATVNGMTVPQNSMNGWTFDPASDTITFHGSAVPPRGATINVSYSALCIP